MDEIIQEALSKGVNMHVAGEFELAGKLYSSVMKLQPKHADANHNMGLLKVDTGQALEALPYLQTALQADTSVAQFWLSYIRALIKLDKTDEATRILNLAKESGVENEELLELYRQLHETFIKTEPDTSETDTVSQPKPNVLDTLKLDKALRLAKNNIKDGSSEEAKRIYQDILEKFPKNKKALQGLAALDKSHQPGAKQSPPQETINQLINLYNQGQLDAVVDQAQNLTKQYPQAFAVWNILGAAQMGLGRTEEASKAFKKVTEINPNYAEGFNNLGATLHDQGQLEEALMAHKQALSLKPDYPDAYYNMGITLKDLGKLDEAIEAYDKALKLKPNFPEAKLSLGVTHHDQGQLESAREAYEQALALKPDYADGYYNMGITLKELGNLDEAIAAYKQALHYEPNQPKAYNNMANALSEQDKFAEAITAYMQALSLKPDYFDAYYNMGNALKDLGKLEEALETYKNALNLKPESAEAINSMGNALQEKGKLDEAVEAYKQALTHKPDYAEAYNNMGIALKDQGKIEEAIEAYNSALSIKPDYPEAYCNKASVLNDQGKFEEAVEAYKQALSLNPDYADVYSNMGIALQDQGNIEEAIDAYHKAITIKPDYADAYNNMSFAKLQTSEWKQGLDLRKWRWKTKKVQKSYLRHFKAPLWDGKTKIHNKTLLIWGEQGPGDMIIWASCLTYFASIHSNLILECHPKLVNLFRLSFPEIKIRPERKNLEEVTEDFDIQVPMETLFGYACKSNFLIEEQQQYLFPDEERVLFWRKKLETLSSGPFIGISWKSPVMNLKRAKNYADLLSWRHILEHSDATFINLQSVNFDTDIAFFNKSFGCNIINFEELDLFNKLEDVAALSQALDQVVSIPTAAVHISTAVGTDTIIPTWKYSSWNNPLFNSRGPNIKFLYKETEEPWDRVMQQASKLLVSG